MNYGPVRMRLAAFIKYSKAPLLVGKNVCASQTEKRQERHIQIYANNYCRNDSKNEQQYIVMNVEGNTK